MRLSVTWVKSSYSMSNGNCVEVWRMSSYSTFNGNCVEAGTGNCGLVHVRDSKNLAGDMLNVPRPAWSSFLAGIKAGEFPA